MHEELFADIKTVIALAVATPLAASAESQFTTGAGTPITASARLDFTITIAKTLFLQVGTGTLNATNGTIDLITFTVPAASIGNAVPVAGTGGDLTGGVEIDVE